MNRHLLSTSPGLRPAGLAGGQHGFPRFSAQPAYNHALTRVADALSHRVRWHLAGLPSEVIPVPNLLAWGETSSGKTEGVRRLHRFTGIPILTLDLASAIVRDDGMNLQTLFGQGLAMSPDFFGEVRRWGCGLVLVEGVDWVAHRPAQAALRRILDGAYSLDVPGLPGPTPLELRRLVHVGLGTFNGSGDRDGTQLATLIDKGSRSIGFGGGHATPGGDGATVSALIRYGLGAELLSRFPLRVALASPDPTLLSAVATAEDGPVAALQQEFARFGHVLEVPPEAVEELVAAGLRKGGGLRGLEAAVGELGWTVRAVLLRDGDTCSGWRIEPATIRDGAAPVALPGKPVSTRQPVPTRAVPEIDLGPLLDPESSRLFAGGALLPERPARHPESDPNVRLADARELAGIHRPARRRQPRTRRSPSTDTQPKP